MVQLPFVQDPVRAAALSLLGAALALAGCQPPTLRQGEADGFGTSGLAFLEVGRTTREEVLLRFGTPNAHFGGERILTYAFWTADGGKWVRCGRWRNGESDGPSFAYARPADNLVLVFGDDGVLARRSLVVAR